MGYLVSVSLYQCSAEPTVVDKTEKLEDESFKYLTFLRQVSGAFKEKQDITAPILDISCSDLATLKDILHNCNYVYIVELQRYYFVTRKVTGLNNIVSIYLNEDVLTSWKKEIYELSPYILRQEEEYNNDLFDNALIPSLKPYYNQWELTISYPKIEGSDAVRTIEYDISNILTFCQLKSGESSCIAIKIFSDANTGATYESKWVQNGGTYINRTYFENIDAGSSIVEYMRGSNIWSVLKSMFVSIEGAINFVKVLPFDAYKAGVGLYKTSDISIVGAPDLNIAEELSANSYMDTQNSFLILPVEPIDWINVRPTNTYFDYEYSLKFNLPFIGTIEIPFIQLINLYSPFKNITMYPYFIINTSNMQGKFYLLKNKLQAQYTRNKGVFEYQGIIDKPVNDIIFESELFSVGINMPLGATNSAQFQIAAAVKGAKAVGGGIKALTKILAG